MNPLNVAMIGCGFMGKAHSNAYAQVGRFFPDLRKVRRRVVCGRTRSRLDDLARAWGWDETETDWRRVVERPDIDVVDICAPNYLHAPIAIAAAEAGKTVLCEKPLANTLGEAESMAAAAAGVPNFVWFNYRRLPAVELAARLVAEGRLGRIYHYRAQYLQQWGPDPSRPRNWKMAKRTAGSGVNGDLNSHLLDTALMLLGPDSRAVGHPRDVPAGEARSGEPRAHVPDRHRRRRAGAGALRRRDAGDLRSHALRHRLPERQRLRYARRARHAWRFGSRT